jgi:hypothetical protein
VKVLTKLARIAQGQQQQKSSIRTKRANRIIQWVLWSPRNALITGVSVGAVLAVGVTVWLTQTIYDYQLREYEAAQQAATAAATPGVGDYSRFGVSRADAATAPAPTSTTPPASTTSTGTPAPAATVTSAPKPVGAEAQAQQKAEAFIGAWLAGPKAASQQAWLDGLAPHVAPELLDLFKLTDRSKIPTGTRIAGMTSVTVPGTGTAHVSATMAGRGVLGVVLEADQSGAWKVVDVAPEDHE